MLSPEQISSFLREYAEAQASLTKTRDAFTSQALEHDRELVGCKDDIRRSFLLVSRFKFLCEACDIERLLGKVRAEQACLNILQQLKNRPQEKLQWFSLYSDDNTEKNMDRRKAEVAKLKEDIIKLTNSQRHVATLFKELTTKEKQDAAILEMARDGDLRFITRPANILLKKIELARLESADPHCVTIEWPRRTLFEKIVRRIKSYLEPISKPSGTAKLSNTQVYREKLRGLKKKLLGELRKLERSHKQQDSYYIYRMQFTLEKLHSTHIVEGWLDHLIFRQDITRKFVSKDPHPVGVMIYAYYEDEVYDAWLQAMRESEMREAKWMKPGYGAGEKDSLSDLMHHIQLLDIYHERDELMKAGQAAGFELKKVQAN